MNIAIPLIVISALVLALGFWEDWRETHGRR
jgi:hypothetical protein